MAAKGFQEYYRPAEYKGFKSMKDVYVTGRDGTRLCIDIYIPNGEGPFPALLSFKAYPFLGLLSFKAFPFLRGRWLPQATG